MDAPRFVSDYEKAAAALDISFDEQVTLANKNDEGRTFKQIAVGLRRYWLWRKNGDSDLDTLAWYIDDAKE